MNATALPSHSIKRLANSFTDILEAAKIKAKHPISYADCCAVATAMKEDASIVTGDPEFLNVLDTV